MGESRNITGTAYALTTFATIIPGHEAALRDVIENLPRGTESPLARLQTLHLSRLQIFDQLVYQGSPQVREEPLKSNYLVFTATFDGLLEPFLHSLIDNLKTEADSWWRHCVGYPGLTDRAAFGAWIRHNQVHTSLFAVASMNENVSDVVKAIALREKVLDFAIAVQGLQPSEVQSRFRQTFSEVK